MKKRTLALLLSSLLLIPVALPMAVGAVTVSSMAEALYFTDESGLVQLDPLGRAGMVPRVVLIKTEDGLGFSGKMIVEALDASGAVVATQTINASERNLVHSESFFGVTRAVYKGEAMDLPEAATTARVRYLSFGGNELGVAHFDPLPTTDGYVGKIHFPEPFASMMSGKFTISKEEGLRKYSTTMSAYTLYDWSDATEIFLSADLDHADSTIRRRTGLEKDEPITARNFVENYRAGAYLNEDGELENDFIFTLVDDFYGGRVGSTGSAVHTIPINSFSYNNKLPEGTAINALIRSGAPSGITWMASLKAQDDPDISEQWVKVDGYENVYKTTQKTADTIVTLFNFDARDEYGIPRPYILTDVHKDEACTLLDEAASLAACEANEGTFFQSADKKTVYCHPRKGEEPSDISLNWRDSFLSGIRHSSACNTGTVIFENIGFMPRVTDHSNNQFGGNDYLKSVFGFIGCKFSGGAHNTLGMTGKYTVYLNDCVAAYGFRDNYNYHSASDQKNGRTESSRAIEVNCISYMNGDFNRIQSEDHPVANSANSNNSSTAHDGMYILRVGGRYFNSQGHHVGDTGCTMTMTLGTEIYDILYSPSHTIGISIGATAQGCAFDCYVTGTRIRYAVSASKTNAPVLDVCGMPFNGISGQYYDMPTLTWEQVAIGEWGTDESVIPLDWFVEWVEPGEPNYPGQPSNPDEPIIPDGPQDPVNPDNPQNPDTPSDPNEPGEPNEPSEPNEPNEPKPAKGCGGMLAGGAVPITAAAALFLRKKKKK